MKLQPNAPAWLPALFHLAYGLIAGGLGYALAYSAVQYNHAAPGSTEAVALLGASVLITLLEISFLAYLWALRRKMRGLWREAARLIDEDKFEQAQTPLIELLQYRHYRMAPQPVLFALGACAEGQGKHREALVLYRRCAGYEPAMRAIGMLQLERGMNESAAEALRKLIARNPDDIISAVLLALALMRGGHGDAASRGLKRALERRPKSELLRQNLARVERGEEPSLTIERKAK